MQKSDWIALGAFFISCASFFVSFWNYRRDSANLKVSADLISGGSYEPYIQIKFINTGRRPAYILAIGGRNKKFGFRGQSFSSENGGLEIKESARKDFNYGTHELQTFDEGEMIEFECLQYVDSNQRRITIKGSTLAIKNLRQIT
ncbi:hypothetical protein NF681_11365 [Comamonadaceae bacterium OTU4NAUVB1]|nr:hypothetical protein NF681_11365 [Comamonadaceae bacterium OTU4NAUVB1]